MEFVKNNWAKIVISCLMILAGIVYIIACFQMGGKFELFKGHALLIAAKVFFFGSAAYLICSMFDQDWAKWILLGVGIVGTVFAGAYFIYVMGDGWKVYKTLNMSWFEYLAMTHALTFLVVFGLFPLVHSIRKLCCGSKNEKAKKTTPAPRAAAK